MMTRNEFLRLIGVSVGATAAATLIGCSVDGGSADDGPIDRTDPKTAIDENHVPPHMITVLLADINAGVAKTYNVMGNSDHDHTVMVTAAQLASLKDCGTLNVTSSTTEAHSHVVTIQFVA